MSKKFAYDPDSDSFVMEFDPEEMAIVRAWMREHYKGLHDRVKHNEVVLNNETAETGARVSRIINYMDEMVEERKLYKEMN